MNISQPTIIFSVDRGDARIDAQARIQAHQVLGASGIPHREAVGQYKGNKEVSFVLVDTPKTLSIVRRLAAWNAQESIMRIDANRQTRLETPQGDYIASLGPLWEVSEETALKQDAYTSMDGRYFITPMQSHS